MTPSSFRGMDQGFERTSPAMLLYFHVLSDPDQVLVDPPVS